MFSGTGPITENYFCHSLLTWALLVLSSYNIWVFKELAAVMVAGGQQAEVTAERAKDDATVRWSIGCSSSTTDVLTLSHESGQLPRLQGTDFKMQHAGETGLECNTLHRNSNYSLCLFVFERRRQEGIRLSRKTLSRENPFQFAKCQYGITDI